MLRSAQSPRHGRAFLSRLGWCGLPLFFGAGAALVLLVFAGGPARPTGAAAPAAVSTTTTFPGCAPTIQQCLNAALAGSTLVIQPGTYITSFTLSKAVNLTGVNSATVILQALPNITPALWAACFNITSAYSWVALAAG